MITEPITWHVLAENPADLPDAELTVVIELDPAGDSSEPVWLGFFDGTGWLDAMGDAVQVIAWADMPKGTAGVMPCCPPGEPHDFSCPNGVFVPHGSNTTQVAPQEPATLSDNASGVTAPQGDQHG